MADRLPIYDIERDIIARLKAQRRLILSGLFNRVVGKPSPDYRV